MADKQLLPRMDKQLHLLLMDKRLRLPLLYTHQPQRLRLAASLPSKILVSPLSTSLLSSLGIKCKAHVENFRKSH